MLETASMKRSKSPTLVASILKSLFQENQLHGLRQLAVVPPMLLDEEERKIQFYNNNGLIRDPFKVFKVIHFFSFYSNFYRVSLYLVGKYESRFMV